MLQDVTHYRGCNPPIEDKGIAIFLKPRLDKKLTILKTSCGGIPWTPNMLYLN
jgi:hypothetical protein